jgi:nucleoside-diphosphate-sugar epimerase
MGSKNIVIVTGANGFVGSHLVDILLSKNYIVRCITRKSSNLKWLNGKNIEN